MAEITLNIGGMSCQHCVQNVQKALDRIESVRSAEVSIGRVTVDVDDPAAQKDIIVKAIQGAGYKVVA
jgi:copper chaperone